MVQKVCLNRSVDDCDIDFVMHNIKHRSYQISAVGNCRFTRFKIDLHSIFFTEILQYSAEYFQRIPFFRKINTAAETYPFHFLQKRSVFYTNLIYRGCDVIDIVVFAVKMKHYPVDQIRRRIKFMFVTYPKSRISACGVGQIKMGITEAWIYPKSDI